MAKIKKNRSKDLAESKPRENELYNYINFNFFIIFFFNDIVAAMSKNVINYFLTLE